MSSEFESVTFQQRSIYDLWFQPQQRKAVKSFVKGNNAHSFSSGGGNVATLDNSPKLIVAPKCLVGRGPTLAFARSGTKPTTVYMHQSDLFWRIIQPGR